MSRRCWVSINLSALQHNLLLAKSYSPNSQVLAVIKANGYGHGMVEVAKALPLADGFAVACLTEAITLRDAGITQPIMLLEGALAEDELTLIAEYQFSMVVHQQRQVEWLQRWQGGDAQFTIWLKLDSGMHRLGFDREGFDLAHRRLKRCAAVQPPMGAMSHFANADLPDHPLNREQYECFDSIARSLEGPVSMANSAALLTFPHTHYDWVRPGIMLFGCSPFMDSNQINSLELQPVMTLQARLLDIKTLDAGEAIGYGSQWQADQDMSYGVVSIGYGDGYPRHAPNGTPVLVNGVECPIIGRVSMDMLCVDLRPQPQALLGDEVTLWGEGLPVERIAEHCGTISYELLCGVTRRVNYHYQGGEC